MDELSSIKKRLKSWEGVFMKEHGRKPGKEDISSSPIDIKDLYRSYYSLKKSLDETMESKKENAQKSSDITSSDSAEIKSENDNVWGAHLNKPKSKSTSAKETSNSKPDTGSSFMKNLGKKLLESASQRSSQIESKNSWGMKRPPDLPQSTGRIFSPSSQKLLDQSNFSKTKHSPRSAGSDDDDNIEVTSSVFALGLKIAKKKKENESISFKSPDEKLNNFVSQMQNRKSAAAKLQNKYRNVSLDNLETGENNISSFQNSIVAYENNAMSSFDDAKHTIALRHSNVVTSPNDSHGTSSRKFPIADSDLSEPPFPISQNIGRPVPVPTRDSVDKISPDKKVSPAGKCTGNSPLEQRNNLKSSPPAENVKKISPERKFKEVSNFTRLKSETTYSQIKPDNVPTARIAHSRKRKASGSINTTRGTGSRNVRAKMDTSLDSLTEDSDSMFIDVGWRPSSRQEQVMIELDGGSMEGHSESDVYGSDLPPSDPENTESPPQVFKKKAPRTRDLGPSKVSNDNFVRLNMKAKKYIRRGGGRSGSAHKRFAWKQKMKARSESFGGSKCFKCGQEGHWAKKCKGPARGKPMTSSFDSSKADDNTVDDADFPSLSQAFNMARGIKLDQTTKSKTPKNTDTPTKPKVKAAKKNDVAGADIEKDEGGLKDDSDEEDPEIIRTAYETVPPPPPMEPLFQQLENGDLPAVPKDVYKALNKFGFQDFRPGQEKAIMRVLSGMSTLVVLSTGAGKSLCYQLPAYVYAQRSKCITLVISPLVSLMEDQVAGLPPGVKGACLHTNMSKGQREKVTEAVSNGDIHFLLISPEALVGGGSRGCLPGVNSLPPIAFACIDEAHCLSEWSHHFRPSYLRICKILKEKFGVQCILGLTATATMVTAASVSKHIGIHDYQTATIRGSPVPPNLYLSVSRDEDRDEALITLLQGDRFSKCQSIIIYCTRREETDRVSTLIRTCLKEINTEPPAEDLAPEPTTKGKGRARKPKKPAKPKSAGDAECYHAGLSAAQRRRVQNAFMSGRLRICVATVAFGMGLDKRDVRGIIHYNLPKSFESYVQEIGRAGRDGHPAHCHLFLDPRC